MFAKSVERWRAIVKSEIKRLKAPFPPELSLSIIRWESGGKAGVVNPKSGASGLTQVMPIALKDYNNNHTRTYQMSDLRSNTTAAARIQIRVGLWILSRFWQSAYRYLKSRRPTVPLDELVKIADTFYAAGPGASKKRLDKTDPSFAALSAAYPDWSAIRHANNVWDLAQKAGARWDLSAIDQWLEGKIVADETKTMGAAIIGLIILVVAWIWMKGDSR